MQNKQNNIPGIVLMAVGLILCLPLLASAARTGVQSVGGYFTTSQAQTADVYYNAGQVGIGSSTPWANLSVKGYPGIATSTLVVASSTNSIEFMVAANGNVGIGPTTTPRSLLSVSAGGTSNGSISTTTSDFGEFGTTTSHSCFNTKNTVGGDISFYFVATTMVVENNRCK